MLVRSTIYNPDDPLMPVKIFDNETSAALYSSAHPNTICCYPTIDSAAIIAIPRPYTTVNTFDYDGNNQSPTWVYYDSTKIVMTGNTEAINAGSYTTIFTPKDNYCWYDDFTTDPVSIDWTINRIAGSASASPSSLSLDTSTPSADVTITRLGDGEVTATSADDSIATVSVSGTTVTVTGVASGSTTITVSVAQGTNYLAATTSISVDVSL